MVGPDEYVTHGPPELPAITIRESTEAERREEWPPPFGGTKTSKIPKYVVVAVMHQHKHMHICSVFGLPQGGDTREEAVFWAERFCSKNGYSFARPEGWGDVVGALPPEDEVEGEGSDHTLARNTDPATSRAADAALRAREGKANVIKPGTHRHLALECFEFGPKTADDVGYQTGVNGIWKRVSDLKKMGLIKPNGHTKMTRDNRAAELLELTDAGWAALAKLR
jgi:hypothetical protein